MTEVLQFSASVYPDRVDFQTHSKDTTWETEESALILLRDEINRLLAEGRAKCPYYRLSKGEEKAKM
jgi:hypothetical protein